MSYKILAIVSSPRTLAINLILFVFRMLLVIASHCHLCYVSCETDAFKNFSGESEDYALYGDVLLIECRSIRDLLLCWSTLYCFRCVHPKIELLLILPAKNCFFPVLCFFSCRSPCSTQLHLTTSLMNLTAYISLKRH